MLGHLSSSAVGTRSNILLNEGVNARPSIFSVEQFQGAVLPELTSEGMVMLEVE